MRRSDATGKCGQDEEEWRHGHDSARRSTGRKQTACQARNHGNAKRHDNTDDSRCGRKRLFIPAPSEVTKRKQHKRTSGYSKDYERTPDTFTTVLVGTHHASNATTSARTTAAGSMIAL
jgi:hypothetical protein